MFPFLRVLSSAVLTSPSCQLNPFSVSFSIYSIYLWYDSMTPVLASKLSSQHRFTQLEWFPVSLAERRIMTKNHGTETKIVGNTLP